MHNRMTLPLQRALSDRILRELAAFQVKHALEPQQMVYWLVSFAWGYARRLGWDTRRFASYCLATFEACEKQVDALHGDIERPKVQP